MSPKGAPKVAAGVTKKHVDETEAFLQKLVAVPSPTGAAGKAVELFVAQAKAWGLDAWVDEVGNGVASTVARKALSGAKPLLMLGHIDTAPGEIPVKLNEETDEERTRRVLWGRGSVDAKGPLVAFLAAAAVLKEEGLDAPLVVVAAFDEEGPSEGARHALSRFTPRAVVIGEPGGADGVTLGYRGKITFTYRMQAPAVHSGAPVEGVPDLALEFYEEVRSLAYSLTPGLEGPAPDGAHGPTPPGAPADSIFNRVDVRLESIVAGTDGITERAELLASIRTPPEFPTEEFRAAIENFLGREKRATEQFAVLGSEEPALVDRRDPVVAAYVAAIRDEGLRPTLRKKTGTSDMCVTRKMHPDVPVATYGPGDSKLDHTPEERLDLDDLARAVRVNVAAVRRLAASVGPSRS